MVESSPGGPFFHKLSVGCNPNDSYFFNLDPTSLAFFGFDDLTISLVSALRLIFLNIWGFSTWCFCQEKRPINEKTSFVATILATIYHYIYHYESMFVSLLTTINISTITGTSGKKKWRDVTMMSHGKSWRFPETPTTVYVDTYVHIYIYVIYVYTYTYTYIHNTYIIHT